jgi:hypothetical protein
MEGGLATALSKRTDNGNQFTGVLHQALA